MKKVVNKNDEREAMLKELEDEFVAEFHALRKAHEMTQQEMADKANVIRETIARIENSITSPQVSTLLKILAPLGYTVKITKIEK